MSRRKSYDKIDADLGGHDTVVVRSVFVEVRTNDYVQAGPEEAFLVSLRKVPAVRAEVVEDPSVMSGEPVVRATRVPAETLVAYLRAGRSAQEIFEGYPTLSIDAIGAVEESAEKRYVAGWMSLARA